MKVLRLVLLYIFTLFLGVTSMLIYGYYQLRQAQIPLAVPIAILNQNIISQTRFSLDSAPSDSISGVVASASGDTQWLSRTAVEKIAIKQNQKIQQGEELFTGSDGLLSAQFANAGGLNMLSNTHLQIIQTLPVNFVFAQDSGSAIYEQTNNTPFSVRSLDLLIDISGRAEVVVDPQKLTVTVDATKGTAMAAFTDNQNTSRLINIPEKKRLIFDDGDKRGIIRNL